MQINKLLQSVKVHKPHVIPQLNLDDYQGSVETIAKTVRAMWLLPRGPVANITGAIENAGGVVIRHDFGTKSVDATSFRYADMPPMFFVNRNIPGDRLRFTLAHELGHLLMHGIPSPTMEDEADRFASEFLMPAEDIKPALSQFSLAKAASLKPYWKVSMWALIRRARDLATISENQYRYLCMAMSATGYKTREPTELQIPVEEPRVYRELIDVHLKRLKFTLQDLAKLIVAKPEELKRRFAAPKSSLRLVAG
jgi:Zn-dependent peptidase ImmA (M78 family)